MIRWAGYVPNRDLSGWVLLLIAVLAGLLGNVLITQLTRLILRRQSPKLLMLLRQRVRWAFYFFLPSVFFLLATNVQSERFLSRHPNADKGAEILFLFTTTWLILQLLKVGELWLIRQYDTTNDVNLHERKFVTQVQFIR